MPIRYTVREMIARLQEDGWYLAAHNGTGHRQFKHPVKPGKVTVSGKMGETIKPGTANSILRQAGLK